MATNDVYDYMLKCWQANPADRNNISHSLECVFELEKERESYEI